MNQAQFVPVLEHIYRMHTFPIQKVNLFGIRDARNIKKDVWDDVLGFFTKNLCFMSLGTTDPSPYYNNPKKAMNKIGTFHLGLGHHKNIWMIGRHGKSQYPALVNRWRCGKVRGWRDVDKDMVRSSKDVYAEGRIGVNMHRRYNNNELPSLIRWDSAGCQVWAMIKKFEYMFKVAEDSGQKKFSYVLFDHKEIPFYQSVLEESKLEIYGE